MSSLYVTETLHASPSSVEVSPRPRNVATVVSWFQSRSPFAHCNYSHDYSIGTAEPQVNFSCYYHMRLCSSSTTGVIVVGNVGMGLEALKCL